MLCICTRCTERWPKKVKVIAATISDLSDVLAVVAFSTSVVRLDDKELG